MPRVYWVTFRIEERGDARERYQRLMDAIRDLTDGKWWTEPTSFVLFRSVHEIDAIADYLKQAINPLMDLALIGMSDYKTARAIGGIADDDLLELMPFTKML